MKAKQRLVHQIEKTQIGKQFINEQRSRIILFAVFNFFINVLYAFYNGILGVVNQSIWFIVMCAYYIILSSMRLSAVLCERKNKNTLSADIEYFVMRLCGILLIVLSMVLAGVIYISLSQNIASKYGEIVMITIATYTFYKITMMIIRAVKQRKNPSPLLSVIRNIGYAEVAASVLTLQRSMLVSFGEMDIADIRLMNIWTGSVVWLFVLLLGMIMIIRGIKKKESNDYGKV